MENECIGCGCTDHNACVVDGEACHWLAVDPVMGIGVCSCCAGSLPEFRSSQTQLKEFASDDQNHK